MNANSPFQNGSQDYTQNNGIPPQNDNGQPPVNVHVTLQGPKGNSCGTAGFILALLGLILFWMPFINWAFWLVGIVLSAIGVRKQPRGLAIAGLVISITDLIALLLMVGCCAAVANEIGAI